jgi:hypothetical protein
MRLWTAVLASGLLAAGCKKSLHPDLPIFPDAMGIKGKGTFDKPTLIVFNSLWTTSATLAEVRAFYEKARPEWRCQGDPERVVCDDGNMKQLGEVIWPVDEAKAGAYVEVTGAGNRTMFSVWQAKPKP